MAHAGGLFLSTSVLFVGGTESKGAKLPCFSDLTCRGFRDIFCAQQVRLLRDTICWGLPRNPSASFWQSGEPGIRKHSAHCCLDELRRRAHHYLRKERPDHTLQSTALVHEAYLRLTKNGPGHFANRCHFFAVSAQLMRQILVEYARSRNTAKRGGGYKLTLEDATSLAKSRSVDLIALDDALNGLARLDPQQSQIVELRFFSGLSIEETARVLEISPATVKRHWSTARVWLNHELSRNVQT
jgi:RNA polymerase sigma factor (TIGR02999 family)